MRVLVLGGTGTIGRAVVRALHDRGHHVSGLARSATAAAALRSAGAAPITGDITAPAGWMAAIDAADAVVQAACGFDRDMGAVEARLLDSLLPAMAATGRTPALIYTGGCWLYGATGDRVADEDSPFAPPSEWAWMVDHAARVRAAPGIRAVVIHPAMVWDDAGGVLRRMRDAARDGVPIYVYGAATVRWPLVHAADLADLYLRALETGRPGATYIGAAITGMTVGALACAIAARFGHPIAAPEVRPVATAMAAFGDWARGYAIDQRLSGERARRELGWSPRRLDPAAVADQKSRSA
ncbi:MAG: NAD-dependent epimerase/dehydratase family protein [Alphaproteobacteria bacterium]